MRTAAGKARQIVVRMLCALALVMVGFSHQPVMAATAVANGADLSAYVLPDGTISPLCVTKDETGKTGPASEHGCDACRITQSVALPLPVDTVGRSLAVSLSAPLVEKAGEIHRLIRPPAGGPRAPPALDDMI